MLKVIFGDIEDTIYNTSVYFDNSYEEKWFDDEFVKEIAADVDKSEVLSSECIKSPVLGQIPLVKLSGGTKTLIYVTSK